MFRTVRTILAAAALSTLMLPLGACNTLQTAAGLATTPLCARSTADEKVMAAAEISYNIPAQAYVSANSHNLLTPDVKAKVKPLLQKSYAYLKVARTAYDACDHATLLSYGTAIENLKAAILPLIPTSGA